MDEVAKPATQGLLTVHTEGGLVHLRVGGVLVWMGSLSAWSQALATPRALVPVVNALTSKAN